MLFWSIFLHKSFMKRPDDRLELLWSNYFLTQEARLQTGAVLKHFPLQILFEKEDYRLELLWSTFLYTSFEKGQGPRLALFWSPFPHISFTKRSLTDWSCSEALSLTGPLWTALTTDWSCSEALFLSHPSSKGQNPARLQTGAFLKHSPSQIL